MLHAPNLDDRRFQDLVDEAKRRVQQRCPEWTEHNVSDPGVTLIETFAYMVDQLVYRLNRVPQRHYVKFLELLGERLYPPVPARVPVTFWLSAPQDSTIVVPADTEASTVRTGSQDAISFTTLADLTIVACSFLAAATVDSTGTTRDVTDQLPFGQGFQCFSTVPTIGDAFVIGLSSAVPHCAVAIDLHCDIEGVGVDPNDPPLTWSAWNGYDWTPCELESDSTGGLNRNGRIVLHVPGDHRDATLGGARGGFLRASVDAARTDQPAYTSSPRIFSISAETVGGTAEAINALAIHDEVVGNAEGVPGERMQLRHFPVARVEQGLTIEASVGDGWERWRQVPSFADAEPTDRVFVLDPTSGTLMFPPIVREPDGGVRSIGEWLSPGATVRVPRYFTGGGHKGNVGERTVTVLRSSVPFVSRVENRVPASGGADAETIDQALARGPRLQRTHGRAVTATDYELLATQAAPELARVRGVADNEPGGIRVLVVPTVPDDVFDFRMLLPQQATLERVTAFLDSRRCLGARVLVEPPLYVGMTIAASIRVAPTMNAEDVRTRALAALHRAFHPTKGGPDGSGWPFGRAVHLGEVFSVLQNVDGVVYVDDAQLFQADPLTGERVAQVDRLAIGPNVLVFGFDHHIQFAERA